MYWGLSPALDFLSLLKQLKIEPKNPKEANFLIIGSFDCRHVLQTIAKRYSHVETKLNFFILEIVEEIYGRQLLLLTTALESTECIGLSEKVHLWMEIYGNTMIRPKTFDFIRQKAEFLIKFVTNPDLRHLIPNLNLSLLQYKEMDTLESVFLFYLKDTTYNPVRFWDDKLRKTLGARYDSREGVFDWDFHMRLKDVEGCDVMNQQEYKYWRKTGIAFSWLETENSEPNLTFVSGIYKLGRDVRHSGFMGSVVNGPFVSFGLSMSCEDEDMLRKSNDRYLKRSTDLIERKLLRTFYEIENGEPYVHSGSSGELNLGVVITELKNIEIEKLPVERDEINKKTTLTNDFKSVSIPDVTINFLPCKTFRHLPEKFKNFFDVIWVGQNLVDHVATTNFHESNVPDGLLLVETSKFLVHFSKDDHLNFTGKIDKLASDIQYDRITDQMCCKNGVAAYRRKISSSDVATIEASDVL